MLWGEVGCGLLDAWGTGGGVAKCNGKSKGRRGYRRIKVNPTESDLSKGLFRQGGGLMDWWMD
jgi:hypothetical protein